MWELVTDTEAENAAASRAQRQAASLSCCLRRVVGEQRVGMGPPRRELQCLYLDHPTPHPAVQNTPRQGTCPRSKTKCSAVEKRDRPEKKTSRI